MEITAVTSTNLQLLLAAVFISGKHSAFCPFINAGISDFYYAFGLQFDLDFSLDKCIVERVSNGHWVNLWMAFFIKMHVVFLEIVVVNVNPTVINGT